MSSVERVSTANHLRSCIPLQSMKLSPSRRRRSADKQNSTDVVHQQGFDLLMLPEDVRHLIYDCLTPLSQGDHLNLLCSCRQLYLEARSSYSQRPLRLRSQDELIDFTNHQERKTLDQIRNLVLGLHGVSRKSMESFLAQVVMGFATSLSRNPHKLEVHHITAALQELPALESISLSATEHSDKASPSNALLNQLLLQTSTSHPSLRRLSLDHSAYNFEHVGCFKNLRALQISGFAETSSTCAQHVFQQLSRLESLTIVGPLEDSKDFSHILPCMSPRQIVTPEVMQHMRPLKHLDIREVSKRESDRIFLTAGMFRAISRSQRESLRSLTLSSTSLIDSSALDQFARLLLVATQLDDLTLTWPGLTGHILESLPFSIQRLELLVESRKQEHTLLTKLLASRHKLPYLRRVTFLTGRGRGVTEPVDHSTWKGRLNGPKAVTIPAVQEITDGSISLELPWMVSRRAWQGRPDD